MMNYKVTMRTTEFCAKYGNFLDSRSRRFLCWHTIKPGLIPLAWPGLKVGLASILAPKLAPNKILAWLQK